MQKNVIFAIISFLVVSLGLLVFESLIELFAEENVVSEPAEKKTDPDPDSDQDDDDKPSKQSKKTEKKPEEKS